MIIPMMLRPISTFAAFALSVGGVGAGTVFDLSILSARQTAIEMQNEINASRTYLKTAYDSYAESKQREYTDKDVLDAGKISMAAMHSIAVNARQSLTDDGTDSDLERLNYAELKEWIASHEDTATIQARLTRSLHSSMDTVELAHENKLIDDASKALQKKIDDGNALMKLSENNVDDNAVRETLQNALADAGNKIKERSIVNMKASGKTIDDAMNKVNGAVQARAGRIAAEKAASEEAAAQQTAYYGSSAAAQQTAYYGSSNVSNGSGSYYSGGSSRSYGAYSDSGGSNGYSYSVGSSCDGSNVAACQSNIDRNGYGVMNSMTTAGGSTYYQIHNSSGGSSFWGQGSVNINGQNHSVSGWQQATYINGKPYGVDDGGQYVQTCGPDGKVWYGKIN